MGPSSSSRDQGPTDALATNDLAITRFLQELATSNAYRFGWALGGTGDLEPDPAWVAIPSDAIEAFGGLDVADDLIEIVPLGNLHELYGFRASWTIYDVDRLTGTVVLTVDGAPWILESKAPGVRSIDLPARFARLVSDDGFPRYETTVEVSVTSLPEIARGLEHLEDVVDGWSQDLRAQLAQQLGVTGAQVQIIGTNHPSDLVPTRGSQHGTIEITPSIATRFGIYSNISWRRDRDHLVVTAVPDPDADTDQSHQLVAAAVDASGALLIAGTFTPGDTVDLCHLDLPAAVDVARVLIGELDG